jgi:tetratricopeptide (TPR) repeat protein
VEERAIVGKEMQAMGELQKAAEILNELKSYDFVTFNKVYNAMGVLYLRANSLFLARECFLNALAKIQDPTGRCEHRLAYRPTRNLGKLELKNIRYAEARPYLEQALQLQIQPKLTTELTIRNELQECCL